MSSEVYVHAGQQKPGDTGDMGDANVALLFSFTVVLIAHRTCLAVAGDQGIQDLVYWYTTMCIGIQQAH